MAANFILDEADHSGNDSDHEEDTYTLEDINFIDDTHIDVKEDNIPNPYMISYIAEYCICNVCNENVKTNKMSKHKDNCGILRKCDLCLLEYNDLDRHRITHKPENLIKCPACAEFGRPGSSIPYFDTTVNPTVMTTHLKSCENKEAWDADIKRKTADILPPSDISSCKCFNCGVHISKKDIKEHYMQCKKTKKLEEQQQPPQQQQQETSSSTQYICDLCGKKYTTCRTLQKHYRITHKQTYHKPTRNKPGPKPNPKPQNINNKKKGVKGVRKRGTLFMLTFKHWFKYYIQGVINGRYTKIRMRAKTIVSTQRYNLTNYCLSFKSLQRKGVQHIPPNRAMWKRRISRKYAISNEAGILGNYHHGHCVIEVLKRKEIMIPTEECALVWLYLPDIMTYISCVNKGTSVNTLRKYMKSRNRYLTDCRAIKSMQCSSKYISKEDMDAIVTGIPVGFLHPDWQAWQIAKRFPHIDISNYQMRMWTTTFGLQKFMKIYNKYWDEHLINNKLESSDRYVNTSLLSLLSPSKKGIIIYGSPGHGKTTTVLKYSRGRGFRMKEAKHCGQFCFSDFSNEDIIWMDDWRNQDIINHQTMLKQLTDELGIYVGERKGGAQFYIHTRKVIITTNDNAEELIHLIPGFKRRFDCIKVSNSSFACKQLFK